MLGALERLQAVRFHASFGPANGVSREEMTEIALQIAGYSGFPAGNEMINVLVDIWSEADGQPYRIPPADYKDDDQRHRDAVDVMRTLNGRDEAQDPAEALAGMERIGTVGKLAFEFAFGDLWSRSQLSRRDRSLVVVSILVALTKPDELQFHISRGAESRRHRTRAGRRDGHGSALLRIPEGCRGLPHPAPHPARTRRGQRWRLIRC